MKDVSGNGTEAGFSSREDLVDADALISFDEYVLTINGIHYTFRCYDGEVAEYQDIVR